MKIYQFLSRIALLQKYSYKFLFVAFIGIHVPLIGMIAYVILEKPYSLSPGSVLGFVLLFTLIATGLTLYVLNQLLIPLVKSKNALEAYIQKRDLPNLPVIYKDEAGILMQKVQNSLMSLDEFVQTKEDMVALISHDLRTPTNRIRGIIELIHSENKDPKLNEYIEMIQKESKDQIELLTFILEQLRQEELEITADKREQVKLLDLVKNNLESFQSILQEKGLQVELDIPENSLIRVEKQLFSQVLQNLIHNACKFSFPKGKISVSQSFHNGLLQLQVVDEGMGFSPSYSEKLFQRFTTHGRSGTQGEESTGIGLYLSRRIIMRHSGSLNAFSEGVNKGAKFEITIPL